MNTELKKSLYNKLDHSKVKINWNKNPIEMKLFLSFLKVEVVRSHEHLGSINGWTLLTNDEVGLRIGGGVTGGIEYLDTIQYREKLMNQYNNYVNPFYIFDIISDEGKLFFLNYYKEDIDKIVSDCESSIEWMKNQLLSKRMELDKIKVEVATISNAKIAV